MKCETLFPCNEWAARIVFERFHYGNRRFIFSNNDNRKKQSLIWHMSIIKKEISGIKQLIHIEIFFLYACVLSL